MAKTPKTQLVIPHDRPTGPLILANLLRLGYADIKPRAAEVARLAGEKGKPISRQRVSQIVNAVRVEPETVEIIAEAIGVKPAELLKR